MKSDIVWGVGKDLLRDAPVTVFTAKAGSSFIVDLTNLKFDSLPI